MLGLTSLTNFLPLWGVPFLPLGNIASAAYVGVMAFTIARHRLLDVQVLFRAGMLYSTLTFLLTVVYFALVLGLQRWFQDAVFAGSLLLPMLPALAVALAVGPLKSSLQERLDRTFFRSRAQMRARGEAFAEVLCRLESEGDVWQAAWEQGWRHAHPESGLVLRHADGAFLTAAGTGTAGVDAEAAGQLIAGLAGPRRLAAGSPFEIAVPVVGRGGLLGGCLLGPKSSGEIWSAEDLAFCAAIAGQTALAVEQARLRERVGLQERLAALGRMAAVVSHELRNPLNVIRGAAAVLRRQLEGQPGAAVLGVVEAEVGRGERFIRDVLFACGEQRPHLVPIDLALSLREVAARWAAADPAGARLELSAPAAGLWVRGDVFQLRQVFENLVRNAAEAGGGSGRIAMSVVRHADAGVTIAVADDGPGIEPRLLPVIFEPFRTTKRGGTGLGLSIAKGVVERHGGRITRGEPPGRRRGVPGLAAGDRERMNDHAVLLVQSPGQNSDGGILTGEDRWLSRSPTPRGRSSSSTTSRAPCRCTARCCARTGSRCSPRPPGSGPGRWRKARRGSASWCSTSSCPTWRGSVCFARSGRRAPRCRSSCSPRSGASTRRCRPSGRGRITS